MVTLRGGEPTYFEAYFLIGTEAFGLTRKRIRAKQGKTNISRMLAKDSKLAQPVLPIG